MSARLREAQLAVMILTRLPAGRISGQAPPIAQAVWAFPVVGAAIGLVMAIAHAVAAGLGLSPFVAALLALAVAALATGAMHDDGLADVADGFGGGSTVSRKLEIMKDSRIGSYGVLILILTTALTASAIATSANMWSFIAIGTISRTAMLLPMWLLPPARSDGLGHAATLDAGTPLAAALALTIGLALLSGTTIVLVLMLATAFALLTLARRQIGGQTGDVLGATQKLSECVGWLTAAALAS